MESGAFTHTMEISKDVPPKTKSRTTTRSIYESSVNLRDSYIAALLTITKAIKYQREGIKLWWAFSAQTTSILVDQAKKALPLL